MTRTSLLATRAGLRRACLPLLLCATAAAWAQAPTTPPGYVASPEIYKVIAENDKYRVIEVVWKPGQKDRLHSHPDSAVYFLTDCVLRNDLGGGLTMEGRPTAGSARLQAPIAAHTMENIGTQVCRLIMFEPR